MERIKKLTEGQEASLKGFRDKWLEIGLSTEPIDEERSKAAVRKMYECGGIPAPDIFVFLDNPLHGALAATLLCNFDNVRSQVRAQVRSQVRAQVRDQVESQVWGQVRTQVGTQVRAQVRAQVSDQVGSQVWDQVRDQVGSQVWDQVGSQVRAQVWDQVGPQVWDQVRDQVWAQVWDQVRDQVWAQVRAQVSDQVGSQVWDQVRDQVWDQVRDQVWAQVRAQVWKCAYGAHDAGPLSFYDFFRGTFQLADKAAGLIDVAQSCGWVWPFENVAVITSRPAKLAFNDEKILHSEVGPAISYNGGMDLYFWHGTKVPADWILERDKLTVEAVLATEDAELRAAGISIIGIENALSNLKHNILDSDQDAAKGELIEVWMDGLPESAVYLKFECPRNGVMMEAVDRASLSEVSLLHAHAQHANIPPHLFNYPEQRS